MSHRVRSTTWGLAATALLAVMTLSAGPTTAVAKPHPTTTTTSPTTTTTAPGGCCLDDTNIIQANGGSTGGSRSATVSFSLPNPVRTDTVVVVFLAADLANIGNPDIPNGTDAGVSFFDMWETANAFGQTSSPYVFAMVMGRLTGISDNWGGGTSWTATYSTPVAVSWVAVEVAGLLDPDAAFPPNDSLVQANSFDNSGSATSLDTTNSGSPAEHDDDLILAPFASRVGSGVPPTVTSMVDTNDSPGEFAPLAASQATSTGTANVRLDVGYKFTGGQPGTYDATASYSGGSFLAGMIGGLTAQPVVPSVGVNLVV
jgi:hypothetical protein